MNSFFVFFKRGPADLLGFFFLLFSIDVGKWWLVAW